MKIIDGEIYVNKEDAMAAMKKGNGFFFRKRCR